MKKILAVVITLLMTFALTACGGNGGSAGGKEPAAKGAPPSESSQVKPAGEKSGKILIAYYSRSGNTRSVANEIQKNVGGDIFEIKTTHSYPEEHRATTIQARNEKDSNFRPQLTAEVPNIDSYDVIFVGYPNWWGTMPMGVFTFLEKYKFAGKTIIPFCTHEGSGLGNSVSDLKSTCPEAKVLQGLALRGSSAASSPGEIAAWLKSIGMAK